MVSMSQNRIKLTDSNLMSFKNLMRDECHVIDLNLSSQISSRSQAFPKFVNLWKIFSSSTDCQLGFSNSIQASFDLRLRLPLLRFCNEQLLFISIVSQVAGNDNETLQLCGQHLRFGKRLLDGNLDALQRVLYTKVKHSKSSIKPLEESHLSMMVLCFFNTFRPGWSLAQCNYSKITCCCSIALLRLSANMVKWTQESALVY